jgi:hypothetical protein
MRQPRSPTGSGETNQTRARTDTASRGIFAASIGALESLLSIGGAHPWWSLAIFALCVYVLHGLIVFGEDLAATT